MHRELAILIPIVAILSTAWVIVTLLRLRQGRGQGGDARLESENAALRATVERLEARMAVLETIATDPAERTAREIEQLRNS